MKDLIWAKHYARRKLLKRVFAGWRSALTEKDILPISNGFFVYLLFKWMTLTVSENPDDRIYNFPFHALSMASDSQGAFFISRIRRKVVEACQVSARKMPLFVHSIAILDAFIMAKIFSTWKAKYVKNKQLDDYYQVNYCKSLLRRWKQLTQRKQQLLQLQLICNYTSGLSLIRQIFDIWRTEAYYNEMYRVKFLTKKLLHSYYKFTRQIEDNRVQAVQLQIADRHCYLRMLRLGIRLWKRRLCYLSKSMQLVHSQVMHDLTTDATRYLLNKSQNSSSEVKYSGMMKIVSLWRMRLASQTSQGCLLQYASMMHTNRLLYKSLQSLRMHTNTISYYARRDRMALSHYIQQEKKKAMLGLRSFAFIVKRKETAESIVRHKRTYRNLITTFGHWLLLAAKYRVIRQNSNKIFSRYISRLLYIYFFCWKDYFERIHLIRSNQQALLAQKNEAISSFTSLVQEKYSKNVKHHILRKWFLYSRDLGRAKRVLLLRWKIYKRSMLAQSMRVWRNVTNFHIIVTCIKKMYRGYKVRKSLHYNRYRYLQHVKKIMPSIIRFRRYWLVKNLLSMWKSYQLEFVTQPVLHSIRLVKMRSAYKKLFKNYRERRIRQNKMLPYMKYFMKIYYALLFNRLYAQTVHRKRSNALVYAYYKQKMKSCMQKLHNYAKQCRNEKYSRYLLKKKNFSRMYKTLITKQNRLHLISAFNDKLAGQHYLRPYFTFLMRIACNKLKARKQYYLSLKYRRRPYYLKRWRRLIYHKQTTTQNVRSAKVFHDYYRLHQALQLLYNYRFNFYNSLVKHRELRADLATRRHYRNIRYHMKKWYNKTSYKVNRRQMLQHLFYQRITKKIMRRGLHRLHQVMVKFKVKFPNTNRMQRRKTPMQGLSYNYTSKLMYHQGNSNRLRLKQLLSNDLLTHNHVLVYLARWRTLLAKRRRNRRLLSHIVSQYTLKDKLRQALVRWIYRMRRWRKYRELAALYHSHHYERKLMQAALKVMKLRRSKRRRQSKKMIQIKYFKDKGMKEKGLVQFKRYHHYHTLYTQYNKKCFKYIRSLLLSARLFLRKLNQKIQYKLKYAKRKLRIDYRYSRYLQRFFTIMRRRLKSNKNQRLINQYTLRNFHTKTKEKVMFYMKLAYLYKKKLRKIVRRFRLVPLLKLWKKEFKDSFKANAIIQQVSTSHQHNLKERCYNSWKLFTYRQMRYKLYADIISSRRIRNIKRRSLQSMFEYIDRKYLYAKYTSLRQIYNAKLLKRSIRAWHSTYRVHRKINIKNARSCVLFWKTHTENQHFFKQQLRSAKKFYINRLVKQAIRKLITNNLRKKYESFQLHKHNRKSKRKFYLHYFRQWKRFMHLRYYAHMKNKRPLSRSIGPRVILKDDDEDMKHTVLLRHTNTLSSYPPSPSSPFKYTTSHPRKHNHSSSAETHSRPRKQTDNKLNSYLDRLRGKYSIRLSRSYSRVLSPYASYAYKPAHYLEAMRCLLHWKRIKENYKAYRFDLLIFRIFRNWKHYIHIYKYKKLAFIQRLQQSYRRTLYVSIFSPLHHNYTVAMHGKYLVYRQKKNTLAKCFHFLLTSHMKRTELKQHISNFIQSLYERQKERMFRIWRIRSLGIAKRLVQISVLKQCFSYWRKGYTANVYDKLCKYSRVIIGWKREVRMKKIMETFLRYRRHKLFCLVHKFFIVPSHSFLKHAFSFWKLGRMFPAETLKSFIRLSSHDETEDMISYSNTMYSESKMREELSTSQAVKILLLQDFSDNRKAGDNQELIPCEPGLRQPRYEEILQHVKEMYTAKNKRLTKPYVIQEQTGSRSLRKAMLDAVNKHQRDVESPMRRSQYIGVMRASARPAPLSAVEEEKHEYAYSPVSSRSNMSAANRSVSRFHLRDIL